MLLLKPNIYYLLCADMCPSQVINLLDNCMKQIYYDLTYVMEIREAIVAKNWLNFMKNINLYIQ